MALQVQRLKAHMGQGEDAERPEDVWALLQAWSLTAPADSAPALEERCARVRQALRP
jgi:hypothetical protein